MGALTSARMYRVLAAFMAVDAALCAMRAPFIVKTLDTIEFPERDRWIFAPIKVAAAIGLLSVTRFPALARLTTAMLTLYFVLAAGFHVRVRDISAAAATAAGFAVLFAAMTASGPTR